jgi:hypothetical protein
LARVHGWTFASGSSFFIDGHEARRAAAQPSAARPGAREEMRFHANRAEQRPIHAAPSAVDNGGRSRHLSGKPQRDAEGFAGPRRAA